MIESASMELRLLMVHQSFLELRGTCLLISAALLLVAMIILPGA